LSQTRRITKAVIPAAGKGTRLYPLSKAVPKEMLPLGRKPVLEVIFDELAGAGITDVLLVISEEKLSIPAYFREYPGIRVEYAIQTEQKGLADAILYGEKFVAGDPFLVALGDSVISPVGPVHSTSRVLDCFAQTEAESVIVVQSTPIKECRSFGMVRPLRWDIGGRFEIDMLVEKPSPQECPSEYAIAGRYAFAPSVFDYIRNTPKGALGELQITDSIGLMLADGRRVWCVPLIDGEIRRDIGTFGIYYEAFLLACLEDPELGASFRAQCQAMLNQIESRV
jgi:UTP--glucose-1-phosphate uridylyltransferase